MTSHVDVLFVIIMVSVSVYVSLMPYTDVTVYTAHNLMVHVLALLDYFWEVFGSVECLNSALRSCCTPLHD